MLLLNPCVTKAALVAALVQALSGCGGEPKEHRGADFETLKTCMISLEAALKNKLRIVIDDSDSVSGIQPDGAHWACVQKSSGTKGVYWEGYYTVEKGK